VGGWIDKSVKQLLDVSLSTSAAGTSDTRLRALSYPPSRIMKVIAKQKCQNTYHSSKTHTRWLAVAWRMLSWKGRGGGGRVLVQSGPACGRNDAPGHSRKYGTNGTKRELGQGGKEEKIARKKRAASNFCPPR